MAALRSGTEPSQGRLVLACLLALQLLLAMAFDQALARLWSGTTALFNLAFPLTLCALVAYFSALAAFYRAARPRLAWHYWRWLPVFWLLAFHTIGSGGATLQETSLASCPVGEDHWVSC